MKFIAVTNRSLCLDDKDFFTRIESLCDVLRKGDKICCETETGSAGVHHSGGGVPRYLS